MIDGSLQVDHLAIELHVHLVEMSSPMMEPAHAGNALTANFARYQWTKPVPP